MYRRRPLPARSPLTIPPRPKPKHHNLHLRPSSTLLHSPKMAPQHSLANLYSNPNPAFRNKYLRPNLLNPLIGDEIHLASAMGTSWFPQLTTQNLGPRRSSHKPSPPS